MVRVLLVGFDDEIDACKALTEADLGGPARWRKHAAAGPVRHEVTHLQSNEDHGQVQVLSLTHASRSRHRWVPCFLVRI